MTNEAQWRREWEVLRAERDLARRKWRSAADGLAARARDPLGLGGLIHDHPLVAGGIGAAAGALLVKLFLRGTRAPKDDASHRDGTSRATPGWSTVLRDAAMSVAVPWLMRTLKEKFGRDLDPDAAPTPAPPQPTDAESATQSARS